MSIVREEISNGVFFNSVKDDRFKTMKISANIIMPLKEGSAAENAVLCGVLTRSCKQYPDFTVLNKKLCSLYGADINASVLKIGDRQVIRITASGIDDRYTINGESVSRELSELLCKVIFEPNVLNCSFSTEDVQQESRQLLELIDSEYNDKRTYAINQMIAQMCKDEAYGTGRYGSPENIKCVTPTSLYEAWNRVLEFANFEIFYIGDSSADKALQVFSSAFCGLKRNPAELPNLIVRRAEDSKHIVEEADVVQAKLVMGFRTDCAVPEKFSTAVRLMSAVLGGTANSKLFCNVREKQSLCYYCTSRYLSDKGILIVDSGVECDNIDKTETAVLKEIEDMKNGMITDFEIESAKLAVVNSFYSSNDTVSGIESWYTSQIFDKSFKSIEELSEEIMAITKSQLVEAARMLTLDTVYVLKSK